MIIAVYNTIGNKFLFQYQSPVIPRTGELIIDQNNKVYKVFQVIYPILSINQLNKIHIKVKEL